MYLCTGKCTIASVSLYIYICTFVLNSGGVQTEVGKSGHFTIAYILLSVARTPQPQLKPVLLHANKQPLTGLRGAWPSPETSPSCYQPGHQTLLLHPGVTGLLDSGRPYAMAVALLILKENTKNHAKRKDYESGCFSECSAFFNTLKKW